MNTSKIHNLKAKLIHDKPQFDSNLGGRCTLTFGVNIEEFTAARQQEINALTQAIEEPQHSGLVFQNLPRHMRRRVMGHSSKRLPRLLRQAHQNQLEKSGILHERKPNRKYKRRPQSILQAFNRRQRDFVWLETHLWHAKRFHMIPKWGYKIPHFPNDKSFRACYRATSQHCMIQDVSFLCTIELNGPLNLLLDGLKLHTRTECGLTFAAKTFLTGAREGRITFFHRERFPFGAVGNVNFLWKPLEDEVSEPSSTTERTLWIWVHPASYPEVLEELIGTFKLELKDDSNVPAKAKKRRKGKNVEQTKLAMRNVPFLKTPKYGNETGVKMVLLKDTLNRFCLTGPLSQAILNDTLLTVRTKSKCAKNIPVKEQVAHQRPNISTADIDDIFALAPTIQPSEPATALDNSHEEEEMDVEEAKPNNWWTEYYDSSPFHKSSLNSQREFWSSLKETLTPAELPPNMVIGLTIVDPRVFMPTRRKKSVPDNQNLWDQLQRVPVSRPHPTACASAIWSPAVRDKVAETKPSVAELNREREINLVPGFIEEEEGEVRESTQHSRIPVLLIQRPGDQQSEDGRIGYGCGWDLVVPAGWAMPLWMALVFRGARPGGLREAAGLRREMSDVEALVPDSMAGRREIDCRREELTEQYFGLPPAKRPNFLKLGISSPFSCSWDVLTREWSRVVPSQAVRRNPQECCTVSAPGPYFVMRDRAQLVALRNAVDPRGRRGASSGIPAMPQSHRICLVPVKLSMVQRGTPEDFSVVCVPTAEDLAGLAADSKYNGPVEAQRVDKNEEKRHELRKEHKALLKRLRKQRVRAKRKIKENDTNGTGGDTAEPKIKKKKSNEPADKEAVAKYKAMNRHLWLPEYSPVKDYCSRVTIGFVSQGDFSLTKGYGAGVGYVPLPALHHLVEMQSGRGPKSPTYVLVRNPTSYQYYFAKLQGSKLIRR